MLNERPAYFSYLLRCWPTSGPSGVTWRASLENPHTGEMRVFAELAQAFNFLEVEIKQRDSDETVSGRNAYSA